MRFIQARNVNDAYALAIDLLNQIGVRQTSRGGDVLVAPSPVVTSYTRPMERVLLDPGRDANPFFHLFESLWMLSGRNDSGFLNRFVRNFGERFAEHDGHIHGAYGRRWRDWFVMELASEAEDSPTDQLEVAVRLLREDRDSRQVVIQMWDASVDLGVPDLKDRPCNTQIYLRVRDVRPALSDQTSAVREAMDVHGTSHVLDLTVTCRSNDVIWGAYGANAVHFSILQEYLAGRIGVGVGTMYQFSNNWHGYVSSLPDDLPAQRNPYTGFSPQVVGVPMGDDWSRWDYDLAAFMQWAESDSGELRHKFTNEWFANTAYPMWQAHGLFREGELTGALEWTDKVQATDWGVAARQWIQRRVDRRATKQETRPK